MEKLWSGRFREPLDARFEQWQRSFGFDVRLLPDEIAASKAYARALAQSGVFTASEVDSVSKALETILNRPAPDPTKYPGVEDVHQFVEQVEQLLSAADVPKSVKEDTEAALSEVKCPNLNRIGCVKRNLIS